MIDPSSQQYRNGRAFGVSYLSVYGMEALLRAIAHDVKDNAARIADPPVGYIAGEIDAALWVVSAKEAKP